MSVVKPKAVLYIVPSASIGGAETFIQHTARFHERSRFRPIYALLRSGSLQAKLEILGVPILLVPKPPRFRNPPSVISTLSWLKKEIESHQIELVHSTMAYGAFFGSPVARQAGLPHVWFQHGPASGWMDRVAGVLPSHGMIVNSEYTRTRQLLLESPVSKIVNRERKILLLPLGVDLEQTVSVNSSELRRIRGFTQETCVFGMLCRVQEWKGVDLFIEALRLARTKTRRPIAGLVFGGTASEREYNSYERELRSAAEKSGVRIDFAGPTQTPFEALGAVDLVVNASRIPEPFGLSIIEGMAAGKGVLVPDEGGPLEIVQNGVNGFLFEARNPSALADLMVNLSGDEALRKKIGIAARESAEKNFNARNCIGKMEDFYDSILSINPRAIAGQEN